MVMLGTAVWEYNLKRLLKSGSNVNAESADAMSGIGSWTAIQRAAAYWSVEMMQLLKTHGADVNFYNRDGFSSSLPLYYEDSVGRTIIMRACTAGKEQCRCW